MACSCSLQRAGFSYLQALPPHAMEHAMCPGMTCRKRSPTFVYFGVGRPELPTTGKETKSPNPTPNGSVARETAPLFSWDGK